MATILVASYGDHTASKANYDSAYAAASSGDTIQFPLNGSATWSLGATVGKAVTIDGNGTTLTSSGSMGTTGFFQITGFTAISLVRITGFKFSMASADYGVVVSGMTGGPTVGQIRIDHNTFGAAGAAGGGTQVYFYHGKGLIDHNYFYNGIKSADISAGTRADADLTWNDLSQGSVNCIFFEDNHHIKDTGTTINNFQENIGTENGGKLVVRHETFDYSNITSGLSTVIPVMLHGNAAAGDLPGYWQKNNGVNGCRRGQPTFEMYENSILVKNGERFDVLVELRSSSALVYNNTVTGTAALEPRIYLWEEEYGSSDWAANYRTAWPGEDPVDNTFLWNNLYRGVDFNTGAHGYVEASPAASAGLMQDRDYWLHAPQSSGGSESFTGAPGGSSSFPTNGSTYSTLGNMIFTASGPNAYYGYTAYTYPHPLQGGAANPVRIGFRMNPN